MPRFTRTRWVLLAVAAVIGALAALPSVAAASLQVTGATLDGVTSTNSPPGGVMEARVTGSASGGDSWQGTEYRFGANPWNCENTSGGSGSKAFDVTAPADPGSYDMGFRARGTNNCGGAQSGDFVLQDALRSPPRPRTPTSRRAAA